MSRRACGTTSTVDEDGEQIECDEGGRHHCLKIGEDGEHWGAHLCAWCRRRWTEPADEY